ncbi:hypothetical protein GH5_07949 [Leishmania sp. Ghana 2012 LV757]|uniref:hypothetical protein n=1 Tax=Leishmania sp. Ghana 2012 LV757 TaxID=2803181 RepID=UPI001B6B9C71|nr:hypothetical protein GH5_07949 [Leishmania sp. Ghana 2012 LV757]
MPFDARPSGDGFNNPYENTTLVGNWLEDRLQRRVIHKGRGGVEATWCTQGLFEDPAVTMARDPAKAQAALLHSTYEVHYGNRQTMTQKTGSVGLGCSGAASTLMLGRKHNAHAAGPGSVSPRAKSGIDKALLFSVDPVADPDASLPQSTYAETYGAFHYGSTSGSVDGNSSGRCAGSVEGATKSLSATKGNSRDTAPPGGVDRNLYDSVSRAAAAAAAVSSSLGAASSHAAPSSPGLRRHMPSRGAATTSAFGNTGWTLASASVPSATGSFGAATWRSRHSHSRRRKDSTDDERWCSSKQAADTPVDHFTLQRRLPPLRM